MITTLLVAALVAYASAAVHVFVTLNLGGLADHAALGARKAIQSLRVWWSALALNIALGATFILFAAFGRTELEIQLAFGVIERVLLAVSLVGLMEYLIFLRWGRDWLGVLIAFYAAYFVLLLYSMFAGQPDGVYVGKWREDLHYSRELSPIVGAVSGAVLVLPPVVAAFACFLVVLRSGTDPLRRYRLSLVAWSLIVWWVVAVVAGQQETYGHEGFQLVSRFTGLFSALGIFIAYRPPAFIRRRLEPKVHSTA